MHHDRVRVVVTGMGGLCSLGVAVPDIWDALIGGSVGVGPIARFDTTGYPARIAAEITGFSPEPRIDRKAARRMDRFTQFAVIAAREAVAQANLDAADVGERVGVYVGTAFGGIESFTNATELLLEKGPRRVSPFGVPMTIANMAPGMIAIDLGVRGPAFAYASAFSGGANAIGEGFRAIQHGRADAVIAGGAEAPITPLAMAAFTAMGALSRNNDDPDHAVRPFDLHRDGCAVGEGAGMLLLERRDTALARGATILAEIVGYGATAEAYHQVQLDPTGDGMARAMRLALDEASLGDRDIGYINAHGTGTEMNDVVETRAIRTAFGPAADGIPISSTKSQTGHLLGAAGGLEAIIAIMAMTEGILPATVNLDVPDPACDLDYIAKGPCPAWPGAILSNSMGFGGHCVALAFKKHEA